ncbi:hypothetical protein [Streptomyces sp. AC512_CC834]|uniref:hypothetical protein n=1 Tax=Streptomyces sp. AC512_CC834 TaxID=2823691 RepID=UPI0027E54634|nr:hypothetical protein [Streptomyces sp. AC512_CC834]
MPSFCRSTIDARMLAQRVVGGRPEQPAPETYPAEAACAADLIFDVVASAVVHRTLVSARVSDGQWVRGPTQVLLWGLAGAAEENTETVPNPQPAAPP